MPKKTIGNLSGATNEAILMALAKNGSPEYQSRIPEAVKSGLKYTLDTITEYTPLWNEFISGLINRIGKVIVRNNSWTNPLANFKKGMLTAGEQVEEIQHGLLKAYTTSSAKSATEEDIFGWSQPYVESNFHKHNYRTCYKWTIDNNELRKAFITDGGLAEFISGLMTVPGTSDAQDEFITMTRLFKEYELRDGFFKVHVNDISGDNPQESDVKHALRRIREFRHKLRFINTAYNASHMPVAANPNDVVLFTTPEVESAIDVEALAAAFNIKKEEIPFRSIVLPKEQMPSGKIQAILTTADFFQIYDTMLQTESIFNPGNVATNFFYHHRGIFSVSRFVPAIAFTTDTGTVIVQTPEILVKTIGGIDVVDAMGQLIDSTSGKLKRGNLYQCNVRDVTYEDPAPSDETLATTSIGWVWKVSGNNSNKTAFMYDGVLRVGSDETAKKLTVTVLDPDMKVNKEVEYNIDGGKVPQKFEKSAS